uniref:hypothetical protein n=1 Tax=Flavobacterium sp. TaxID=239 RepID=UPI00404A9238
MNPKKINRHNFFKNTFCFFNEIKPDAIKKDNFNYHSKSGSLYYFTDEGVFRSSSHWGRVGNCRWKLISETNNYDNQVQIGFARWEDFYENDDQKKLFFVDWNNNKPSINHWQHPNFNETYAVFNAQDAKKRRQTIELILETSNWNQYLDVENTIENQQKAIHLLRTTTKTWLEIKRIL